MARKKRKEEEEDDGRSREEERDSARARAIERAERYLSEAVPPPPSPRAIYADLSASKVLEICRLVALWTPIESAMRALGRREGHDDWMRYAQESADPFWPWALSALRTAEGIAIHLGSDALRLNALDGDTKALTFFLSHRTKEFAPPAQRVEHAHGGTIGIELEVSRRATAAIERAEGRVAGLLPAPVVEDAEFEPVTPEAAPKPAAGGMFKMRPKVDP